MIKVAVLTVSDRSYRGEREDTSGGAIKDMIQRSVATVTDYEIIADEKSMIKKRLISLSEKVDLVLTIGGTGLSPRDVTPDATLEVIEREVPGITEWMRAEGLKKTPHAALSRAVAGTRGGCLIINLPGSLKGARESLETILPLLPHAIEVIRGETLNCGARSDR
ncbi:MAG TPA: MogA/MoaB family molybdenum cofactor biosynthesis protein [Candidatus Latescibacteria bacterium]|nr:MogA/MoaB family molybdenum cofactor biosynthesis protein [Candidatus Latescibacterota bacterium]